MSRSQKELTLSSNVNMNHDKSAKELKNKGVLESGDSKSSYTAFDEHELYNRDFELDDERTLSIYQSYIGDVGCVVWDAAIVLGKFYEHLYQLKVKPASYHAQSKDFTKAVLLVQKLANLFKSWPANDQQLLIELGSGTGFVGIVAAMLG